MADYNIILLEDCDRKIANMGADYGLNMALRYDLYETFKRRINQHIFDELSRLETECIHWRRTQEAAWVPHDDWLAEDYIHPSEVIDLSLTEDEEPEDEPYTIECVD